MCLLKRDQNRLNERKDETFQSFLDDCDQAYASRFKPILSATYNRWLEEKSKCPIALKELEEDEMEPREKEGVGTA